MNRAAAALAVSVGVAMLSLCAPAASAEPGAARGQAPSRAFPPPLSPKALAQQRGGSDGAGLASLQGSVSDARAVNVATGGNVIGGGALSGASGVPVVIQNSGNNVLIQSATIVNVTVK